MYHSDYQNPVSSFIGLNPKIYVEFAVMINATILDHYQLSKVKLITIQYLNRDR